MNTNVPVTLNYTLSGGRFETSQLHSWFNGSTLTLNVSGDGVLALANGLGNDANNTGAFSTNGANSRLLVTFTEGGTLEPTSGGLGQRGEGTKTITFNGGAIRFGEATPAEVSMTVPVVFAGTEAEPTTIDPGTYGTLVLNAANTGSGALTLARGTLALVNAKGLGDATVTIADGAAFEARGLASDAEATGKVAFQDGSQCRVTAEPEPELPYTARIAGTIDLPDSGKDGIRFFLDGEEFAVANVEVDEGNGTVTFGAGGPIVLTDVVWDVTKSTGTWADGEAGPWQGGTTFRNGAGVTFPAPSNAITATLAGAVKPASVTFGANTSTATYTFAGEPDAYLDLSAQTAVNAGSTTNQYIDFANGAGATFDVPVATSGAGVGINLPNGAVRLVGALSDNNRTATLLGSGNLNAAGQHGVWHASGDLTLMPRAGETQRLSAYSGQLYGDGTIIVQGQVADDGSVSGGTVEFGGTSPSGGNNAFSGTFMVRDGATLDFTMTRTEGGDNPYFQASDGTPLYKGDAVGFTLRNGGVLRFSGHRGFLGGWGQISNSTPDLWTSQPIVIGYRSAAGGRSATAPLTCGRASPSSSATAPPWNASTARAPIGSTRPTACASTATAPR